MVNLNLFLVIFISLLLFTFIYISVLDNKKLGYKYVLDFDYGSGYCCKIMESCVIFNIFYNNYNNVLDFKLKCLEPKTLEVMFIYYFANFLLSKTEI